MAINKQIQYFWFDPATGESLKKITAAGDEFMWFECPNPQNTSNPENKDWVLFVNIVK